MKKIIGKYIINILLTSIITAWIVYAATNITSITQTAVTGDKITAGWVNEVNSRLSSPPAVRLFSKSCSPTSPCLGMNYQWHFPTCFHSASLGWTYNVWRIDPQSYRWDPLTCSWDVFFTLVGMCEDWNWNMWLRCEPGIN